MKLPLLLLSFLIGQHLLAADSLYHPKANAKEEIARAILRAREQKKHVLIQAGGNWCGWCIEFNRFVHADPKIDSILNSSFVVYHLNYSKENYNYDIFKQYGFPSRFGFPVFLILNEEGQLIHTQNSSYLESGKSYDLQKVKEFFLGWTPAALQESRYSWMNK